jgi:hypothetical protein
MVVINFESPDLACADEGSKELRRHYHEKVDIINGKEN